MAHAITLNAYADSREQPGLLARLRLMLADYRAYREVYDELDSLSDRELADIGLSRHGIRDVARDAVH